MQRDPLGLVLKSETLSLQIWQSRVRSFSKGDFTSCESELSFLSRIVEIQIRVKTNGTIFSWLNLPWFRRLKTLAVRFLFHHFYRTLNVRVRWRNVGDYFLSFKFSQWWEKEESKFQLSRPNFIETKMFKFLQFSRTKYPHSLTRHLEKKKHALNQIK